VGVAGGAAVNAGLPAFSGLDEMAVDCDVRGDRRAIRS